MLFLLLLIAIVCVVRRKRRAINEEVVLNGKFQKNIVVLTPVNKNTCTNIATIDRQREMYASDEDDVFVTTDDEAALSASLTYSTPPSIS